MEAHERAFGGRAALVERAEKIAEEPLQKTRDGPQEALGGKSERKTISFAAGN